MFFLDDGASFLSSIVSWIIYSQQTSKKKKEVLKTNQFEKEQRKAYEKRKLILMNIMNFKFFQVKKTKFRKESSPRWLNLCSAIMQKKVGHDRNKLPREIALDNSCFSRKQLWAWKIKLWRFHQMLLMPLTLLNRMKQNFYVCFFKRLVFWFF